jgi:hypothetical protein
VFKKKEFLAFLLLLFSSFQFAACLLAGEVNYEETTKIAERAVKEDPIYRDLDNLCHEIPLPDNFELLGKRASFKLKGITYYYNSEMKVDFVEKFYKDYFAKNGWELSETNTITKGFEFTNEEYRVEVYYLGEKPAYTIHCFKKLDINKSK